jgi:hypothetical protein
MKNTVKNAIRHLVTKAYEVFAKDKNNISVVSLPGSVWEFETSVINHKDFADNFSKSYNLDMQLAECDNNIYDSNLRPISTLFPHNKVSSYALSRDFVKYYNQYLNTDIVKKAKSDNIFAWFDFCGNPTTQSLELINTAIGKNVTYVFTFNTHWRCDTNVDRDVLSFAKSIDNKPVAIHTFVEKIALNAGLTIVWSFEYISNHNPMITICISNDANVIAEKSFNINTVASKVKKVKVINKPTKRDLSAVYVDVKAKVDDKSICVKHNITVGTLAAVKAWVTMGK